MKFSEAIEALQNGCEVRRGRGCVWPSMLGGEGMTKLEMTMNGEQFSDIFSGLRVIVNEARIMAANDGIKVCHVDPSNTMLVNLILSPKYFVSYKYENTGDGIFEFGIDVSRYVRIKTKNTDVVRWTIDSDTDNCDKPMAYVVINNTRTYSIECFDIKTVRKHSRIPKQPEEGATVEFEALHFCETLSAISEFGDRMSISFDDTPRLIFESGVYSNVESKKLSYDVDVKVTDIVSCSVITANVSTCRSKFLNNLVQPITKYLRNKRKIEMNLGQDYPFRVTKRNLGQDINSEIMFLVAPRIPSDGED